jgi:hypothetical protein
MLISEKQQAANQQNAQRSTGPKTPDGKAAIRFNALTWSLRARSLIIDREDPIEYQRLWDALDAEFQPQNEPERHYLEQMVVARWLLARAADSENRICSAHLHLEKEIALIDRVDARRARLERSFTEGLHQLQRLQKERQARAKQPSAQPEQATPRPAAQPVEAPLPPPVYMMAEHPAPDTR